MIVLAEPTGSARAGKLARRALAGIAMAVVVLVVTVWLAFPFYWAILNAIKPETDIWGNRFIPWLQFEPTLRTIRRVMEIREVRSSLWNSAVIGFGGASIALLLGVPAAYGVARFTYGRVSGSQMTNWFLGQRIMPPVIFAPPIFILARALGMLDTLAAQAALSATFNLSLVVMILAPMIRDVPLELEQAAELDGASRWEVFSRITLPLVAPGIVACWLISLAFSWNQLFFALVIASKDAIPMTVLIAGQTGVRGTDFPAASTMALLMLAPPTLIALFSQRYIVRGLSLGAVRG
jgi:multiple sugar transport system permease protein